MKIGMVTDSLGHLTFEQLLPTAAELGIKQFMIREQPAT